METARWSYFCAICDFLRSMMPGDTACRRNRAAAARYFFQVLIMQKCLHSAVRIYRHVRMEKSPGCETMAAQTPATSPLTRETESCVDVCSARTGSTEYAKSAATTRRPVAVVQSARKGCDLCEAKHRCIRLTKYMLPENTS